MKFKLYSSSIPFRIKVMQTFFAVTALLAFTNMNTLIEDKYKCIEKLSFLKKLKHFILNPQIEIIQYYYVDFVFMIGLAGWLYSFLLLVNEVKKQGKFTNSLLVILIVLGLSADLFENFKLWYFIYNHFPMIPYFNIVPEKIYFLKFLFPLSFLISYAFIYAKCRWEKQTETTN